MYPANNVAANVLGFVGSDGKGLGGLEYQYQNVLAGKNGQLTVELGHNGQVIPDGAASGAAAVSGHDIQLTIDHDIQWKAQQAIAAQVQANWCRRVVPSSSCNRAPGRSSRWRRPRRSIPANPGASAASDRGNTALSDVFEPGSTNKVITMAAAIDSGVLTPTSPIDVPPTLGPCRQGFPRRESRTDSCT